MNTIALTLEPTGRGWVVKLTNGDEFARVTGHGAKQRALHGLASERVLNERDVPAELALPLMTAGRVVQGAAAGMSPVAFGIIRDEFPDARVLGALGLFSATVGVGTGGGVVLPGLIVEHVNYYWLFLLPLIPVIAVLAATVISRRGATDLLRLPRPASAVAEVALP
jgi:hypothetical protein